MNPIIKILFISAGGWFLATGLDEVLSEIFNLTPYIKLIIGLVIVGFGIFR